MTIDAVLVAITMPYEVFLDNFNGDLEYLYDQISNTSDTILPLNTKGRIRVKEKDNSWYPTELFVTQEQWREQQLNQLGI